MSRGGKREGAGRKKGSVGKRVKALQSLTDKALSEGQTPLEYMLSVMRMELPKDAEPAVQIAHIGLRFEAAVAAAPYVHPKKQPVDDKGSSDVTVNQRVWEEGIRIDGFPPFEDKRPGR
jgi:hypothetical protein